MALRRREIELSVERPLGAPADGTIRLSARYELDPEESSADSDGLALALTQLREELATLVGSPAAATHKDRELVELIETYHPRQAELLELLHDEGELSPREFEMLRTYLATAPSKSRTPPPTPVAPPIAPSSAPAPVGPATPRPVAHLLQEYHIETLRQAGAVRARRQISFEEYMTLKRHFEETAAAQPSNARPAT